MTTYAFPTFTRAIPFTEWQFGQVPNVRSFTSPLSGTTQVADLPGARWAFSLRLDGLTREERGIMEAFMAKLRGGGNRFTCHDLINPRPRGTMRGSVVTFDNRPAGSVTCSIDAGAGQAGTTLLTGDKLTIAGELKVVTSSVGLDGNGRVWIDVEPPFRAAFSAGASVVWDKPTAQFMPVEPSWRIEYRAPRFGGLAFDAIEVFS
jgi:hypothetical protein